MEHAVEELGPASVLCKRPGLAWQLVAGEGVIVDVGSRLMHGMNATAFGIWERVDGRRSLQEIAVELAAVHGVTPQRALQDVLAFGGDLCAQRLVEPAP